MQLYCKENYKKKKQQQQLKQFPYVTILLPQQLSTNYYKKKKKNISVIVFQKPNSQLYFEYILNEKKNETTF